MKTESTDTRAGVASAAICSPLPCPFCGSDDLEETLWRGKLMIACNACQSTGPWASSWQEAMDSGRSQRRAWELWGKRTPCSRLPYPLRSHEELAGCLIMHGLLDESAWYDPDGWDGGIAQERVCKMLDTIRVNFHSENAPEQAGRQPLPASPCSGPGELPENPVKR